MPEKRIKISSIIENQFPNFVKEEFPLAVEFFSQYYKSLEYQGAASDLIQNIDKYVKIDSLANLTESTILLSSVDFLETEIFVESTYGFPDNYGLLLINDEIITYTSKTTTSFVDCVRGFSGNILNSTNELVFTESFADDHLESSTVTNLSILFLKQFFIKVKKQIAPGFENRELNSNVNERLLLHRINDFYSSKGTDSSFSILFNALYGTKVEVIRPRDYLIQPSDAQYRITRDLIVESISGNPLLLENKTLYQDQTDFIQRAEGTISKVERIIRGEKEYYTISLDYDYDKDINVAGTTIGSFSIHPKTKLITQAEIEVDTLDVDSTVGFPNSGELYIEISEGNVIVVSYQEKTLNQFFGCSGITQIIPEKQEINLNVYAYGYAGQTQNDVVQVRILGVLSDLEIDQPNYYYEKEDLIQIKTLGKSLLDQKSNNWIYNVPTKYDVKRINLVDISDFTYEIELYDDHNFYVGDLIRFIDPSGVQYTGKVKTIRNKNTFSTNEQGELNPNISWITQKVLSKINIKDNPQLSKYTANIQNTYVDDVENLYIASPSLPYYSNQILTLNDRSVTFSGTFFGDTLRIRSHGFYTGDSIAYNENSDTNRLNLLNGVYFVYKIDSDNIKLAKSKENIDTNNFISISGTVTNNKFYLIEYVNSDLSPKQLEPQKIIRKLSIPEDSDQKNETIPGETGILINGIEIKNYKSNDLVYYGPLKKINVTSAGNNYDVINPPELVIEDSVGTGATSYCSVKGKLTRIEVIDPGFDYLEEPIIRITGGNGVGAVAKANLIPFEHFVEFNSIQVATLVNLTNNTIGFSTHHKFRDAERVIYDTQGQQNVGGITNGASYYVSVQDAFTVKLHETYSDASVGINTINLISYGIGNHRFISTIRKKKIGSVSIINSGNDYQNKKITVSPSGISTASNSIISPDHGYKTGEIIIYENVGIPISGLSVGSYYITVISENEFKLSNFGNISIGEDIDFYFKTKQYVKFINSGSGTHIFNYPPIQIEVNGNIGVSTFTGQNYNAILRPIIRGEIQSVFLESGGQNYGSESILNYNKQPQFILRSGFGAEFNPVIVDGKISEVIVINGGNYYNSPPTLSVTGNGQGAVLIPVISNGSVSEVKVIFGGNGYIGGRTFINVTSTGFGAEFEAEITAWRVNLVQRLIETQQIVDNDGVLNNSINENFGLQYSHAYAPRKLREILLASRNVEGVTVYQPDLVTFSGREVESISHSPIIGWAYDGNPIYGPYGYTDPNGSAFVKSMKSGYELIFNSNRPSTSLYSLGFFVEDYQFTNSGDLDEYNGRFSVTPDYPNGVYAYFCTIDSAPANNTGSFRNYKTPVFPYIIGNYYKSKPIEFNFQKESNQDQTDINKTNWIRNTSPYGFLKNRSYYDYLDDPNEIKKQFSVVKSFSRGNVDSIGISSGGNLYQVKDVLVFDQINTGGTGISGEISEINGKNITKISVATSTISGIEFEPLEFQDSFIGFSTIQHNLRSGDIVTISTKYDYQKIGTILVDPNVLTTSTGIGSAEYTGLVTYFSVFGRLNYPNITENDIYQIENEEVKIIGIDPFLSRIQVIRNQNGTVGIVSYSSGTTLTELPRKFEVSFGISTSYNFTSNRELYFNPSESLGIGTTSGVGVGYTISFNNPGIAVTQIKIPTQSIYLPGHNLNTNTELIYSPKTGNPISISTDGISSYSLQDNSRVYVAKISDNLIGISTGQVGLGTLGNFIGIGTISGNLLYFTSVGLGDTHSFKTNFSNVLIGTVDKNIVTVSTSSTHGLKLNDEVIVDIKSGIQTNISILYNDYNRRIIANPKSFSQVGVNTENDTILIPNHRFYTGQKIIHSSISPSGGLSDNEIYYVIVVDSNTIKLSDSYYSSTLIPAKSVGITSSSYGNILPINPQIEVIKNNKIIFDVSDSSLSFEKNSVKYSAFDLNFYKDSDFQNEIESNQIKVTKNGQLGITSTATIILDILDDSVSEIYYKLSPIDLQNNAQIKKEVIIDDENLNHNKINLIDSFYSGTHIVSELNDSSFKYVISDYPEIDQYTLNEAEISYRTNSKFAYGEISKVKLISKGSNYKKIPSVKSVKTIFGNNSLLIPQSQSIGSINKIEIQDIGFNYSSDLSVRPTAKLPDVLKIEALSSIESIGVSSVGRNYTIAPKLVVIDGLTNKIISDLDLNYELGNNKVIVLKNTRGISNVTPTIIPTQNVNGVGISTIRFIQNTKDVVVTLGASFSDPQDFPFNIGDKVLVENVSVGVGSTGKGYNSSNYNYALFTIVNTNPNLGGIGATVSYYMGEYVTGSDVLGTFDPVNSSGRIIPQNQFPIFDVKLKKNDFYVGETVVSKSSSGIIQNWDDKNGFLKVSTNRDFVAGELLTATTSQSQALIVETTKTDAIYVVGSGSTVRKGWNTETGFLNNKFQRLHDSDYYQYFSYSLKSNISLNTWDNAVDDLNHTSGFKKFSDLVIETQPDVFVGINTDQNNGDFTGIVDYYSIIDLNCVHDFDLARETTVNIDNIISSDEIIFNSRTIQDYFESIGNRVLMIDNIGDSFNSNPRSTVFSIVDVFSMNEYRYRKYICLICDKFIPEQRQIMILSFLHDDNSGYMNQYGRVQSIDDLGSFDFLKIGTDANILFYPVYTRFNDYDISLFSYNLDSVLTTEDQKVGDIVNIETSNAIVSTGTTTVIGISSDYRTTKVLVSISADDDSYFESNELTLLNNGTDVFVLEYGQLTTSGTGIGSYDAYISGSNINLDFTPNTTLSTDHIIQSISVSIANTSVIGVGSTNVANALLESHSVSISSSPTPSQNLICQYDFDYYRSAYYIISIEDLTNNQYQVSEILSVTDESKAYWTEYGILETNSSLGEFYVDFSNPNVRLFFTPNPDIEVEVRVLKHSISHVFDGTYSDKINLNNGTIQSNTGSYEGTERDVIKSFNLTHRQRPIFERYFDASLSSIVDTENNVIQIPGHFFVTGEEVSYNYSNSDLGTTNAIGIGTTTISGIGATDKLPKTLYIIKENELNVRVAASVSEALSIPPNPFTLSNVGIGTSHIFRAKNQNSKSIITIDNIIQSPIVSTAITTTLSEYVSFVNTDIVFTGITSFFGGDFIQINDEIMKITAVGYGQTNKIAVERARLGTGIGTHEINSLVTKIKGNYNIVNNVLNFAQAPYGQIPSINPNSRYDEVSYVGLTTSSTFSGRVFLKSGTENTSEEPYYNNYIFDDISSGFVGDVTNFRITADKSDVTGIQTSNAIVLINNVFQIPTRDSAVKIVGGYEFNEGSGITTISFVGNISSITSDVNTASIPRGGIIVSVGSTKGFGYQPLVSAGATAVVSIAGTISSISIGNSGSGYRSAIQTIVNVGVATTSFGTPNIEFIGTATVSNGNIVSVAITNPGSGYTSTNPPVVIFDDPLSYANLSLIYSDSSVPGIGTGAQISIVVGQGSSVIGFEIINNGYGYRSGEILTIQTGGVSGIPTDTSLSFVPFELEVEQTFNDDFSGWSVGDLQIFDPIDSLFDGQRKEFPLLFNGLRTTIKSRRGSNIDIQATLLVFINSVLQVPNQGYTFRGGSSITFSEPPKPGDESQIIFYRGNGEVDVNDVDILETIKVGDTVRLYDDRIDLTQEKRLVTDVVSSDVIDTNLYSGIGVVRDDAFLRPLVWCRQTEDKIINGVEVGKDRIPYISLIQPTTNIIQNVGVSSNVIFVESAKTFFDALNEYEESSKLQRRIYIISQDEIVTAEGTANVSIAGTISSITITKEGVGYTTSPSVTISAPVGFGTTQSATAISSISIDGNVNSISVINSGAGYTTTNPPSILIESPNSIFEEIKNVTYEGDFGIITGIGLTSVGVASTGIVFDFFIPQDSVLRDLNLNTVGIATTGVSGIQTGYFFTIRNSNVGNTLISLDVNEQIVGVGTTCIDNVYQVANVSIAQTSVPGIGVTYVAKVTVSVSDYNGLTGIGFSGYYGEYSWGRLINFVRTSPKNFTYYNNGISGINTSPIIQRINPLKFRNYIT